MKRCQFNDKNTCYAMACYDNKKCSAKDKDGNPRYATVKAIREKEALKEK